MIRTRHLTLSPAGGAGAATASGSLGVFAGRLVGVGIDYTGVPATTDVTISSQGRTILALRDSNTDGLFQPLADTHDSAGAAVATDMAVSPVIYDSIDVDVAQADASAEGVKLTLYIEE